MLTPDDLDGPAQLQYWATDLTMTSSATDWEGAREFSTLREALQFAIEEMPEPGKEPYILTVSGFILTPAMLPGLWETLREPS
jgi:hypothetical protein